MLKSFLTFQFIIPCGRLRCKKANCVIIIVTEIGIVASIIVLPKEQEGEVTRRSILEYARAVRPRYLRASKQDKTRILDEFIATSGMHRKAVIRLLNKLEVPLRQRRHGRPRLYSLEVQAALKAAWEVTDRLCSKRLQPFLPELIEVLTRVGELKVRDETKAQLVRMSASTIDRILRRYLHGGGKRNFSTTKPGTLLKNSIPVRTFSDWNEKKPGFFEVDLVAHCGDNVEGFYLNTLSAVDVATGWVEPVAVWGKGQSRVRGAVHDVREQSPFPMLGLDSDNGSEFINRSLYGYCQQWGITFTRARSYKKNDSCHVEQKNWSVIRRIIGYDRFSTKAAFKALGDVYTLLRLYINFFQPVLKLVRKVRHGSRVYKVYDTARTPYRRLLSSGVLGEDRKRQLSAIYNALNPVILRRQIIKTVEYLWTLAE